MVWEKDVRMIVMMTGLREGGYVKCDRYWPETGSEMETRHFTVGTATFAAALVLKSRVDNE